MRKKAFIIIGIIVLTLLSVSFVYAYKKNKLSQAPTPVVTSSEDLPATPLPQVVKNVRSQSGRQDSFIPGEALNMELIFDGMRDKGFETKPADIMLAIDRSRSMGENMSPDACTWPRFYLGNGLYEYSIDNTRLCHAKRAAEYFIEQASAENNPNFRIGIILFATQAQTTTEPVGSDPGCTFFSGLKVSSDENQKNDLLNILNSRNSTASCGITADIGSAQGKALDIASKELLDKGQADSRKFIILLGDGMGNREPYVTRCNTRGGDNRSFDVWPDGWPPIFGPGVDCGDWNIAPAKKIIDRGQMIFVLGYHKSLTEWNEEFLRKLAAQIAQAQGVQARNYYENRTGDELKASFNQILRILKEGGIFPAPIHLEETLAPGAAVTLSNISVKRSDGTLLPRRIINLGSDPNGRTKITIDISPDLYSATIPPENERFTVTINNINTANLTSLCVDLDQNCNLNGVWFPPAERPSFVEWSFPVSGRAAHRAYMRCCKICSTNQYSGDIYGTGIAAYAFPGIDVMVSRGGNAGEKGVWRLSDYDFSDTSYSDYAVFKTHISQVFDDLWTRAQTHNGNELTTTFSNPNPNRNKETNPQGAIYKISGKAFISNDASIPGKENRATYLIDGDLDIRGAIEVKKNDPSNNILLLVKGRVNIAAEVKELNLAIVSFSDISLAPSLSPLKIKGLLVGDSVLLRPAAQSQSQSINYDPAIAIYPPPGLSAIGFPLFKEVAP